MVDESVDLGDWDSFATDEDLYDLSECKPFLVKPFEPLESPVQCLRCTVSL